ncbi:MAG: hypothetical protein HFE94_01080 [Acutalibacter sp.]|nr:hypothetical protein [Acutalibacter sp.]
MNGFSEVLFAFFAGFKPRALGSKKIKVLPYIEISYKSGREKNFFGLLVLKEFTAAGAFYIAYKTGKSAS